MSHAHQGHGHAGHDHPSHDHDHTPTVTQDNERKVLLSFGLIFTFMIVEVVGGLVSGSLALLADAGHMLTDAAALGLAYLAFRFGRRLADSKRTFGYLRFEVVAGFVNAITLFAIVAWISYEAWQRFREPSEVLAGPMLAVAAAGLLINILVFWILTRGDSEHVNIKGAALHVMGDLLGSVGAVAAAIIISLTGWTPIDPILSVVVSLLILGSAWKLLGKSLHILLEGAPADAAPDAIIAHLKQAIPGVAEIGHIHVWSITSGRTLATLHVRPTADADARDVVQAVERALRVRFNIEHPTVAVDWNDGSAACSLSAGRAAAVHPQHDDPAHGNPLPSPAPLP
jgi:cobalt-zinc-cadmium efflux system protein